MLADYDRARPHSRNLPVQTSHGAYVPFDESKLIVRTFLIIAFLFSVGMAGAASNPPAPATLQSAKQEQVAEPKKEANSDKRGTKDAPLIVEMIPAQISVEIAKQQAAHKHEKSLNEKLITYGTAVPAMATALLAWFTFRL